MPLDAPSYITRQADDELHAALQRGEFCYVLTARQMGKSSLMGRTAARLREDGVAVVRLDLTALGTNLSAEQWYGGLLDHLGRQLDLEKELEEFWLAPTRLGPLHRWMTALREIVLPAVGVRCQVLGVGQGSRGDRSVPNAQHPTPNTSPLVIFIDEIDFVRSLPFSTDEFFAAIRECYNRRVDDPELARLTFCLLGVATPSDLIQDVRATPFNIGHRIELTDFTEAEATPLAAGLGVGCWVLGVRDIGPKTQHPTPNTQHLLRRILYWTGGHPYLTQRLCRAVAEAFRNEERGMRNEKDPSAGPHSSFLVPHSSLVDRLCEQLFLSPQARERDDNLLFVRDRLLRSEGDRGGLLELYGQIWNRKRVPVDETNQLASILRLSGIARVTQLRPVRSSGRVPAKRVMVIRSSPILQVRNRIYERVFDREWVIRHMPDAELSRQRAAYRRGLLRATAMGSAVLTVVAALALVALSQARRATAGQQLLRRSLYAAQMSQAQQAWDAGDLARTRKLLEAQLPQPGQEDLRGFEWRYYWRLCELEKPLDSFTGGAFVTFSANGRIMASGGGKTVTLRDGVTRRPVSTLKNIEDAVTRAALSPDGKLLAAADWRKLKLWDTATGRVVGELKGKPGPAGDVAFSPDGKTLAASDGIWWVDDPPMSMSTVMLWDVATRRERARMQERGRMFSVTFSPDGKTIATAGIEGLIKLWSAATGKKVGELKGHEGGVNSVVFSPDGRTLASGGGDWTARLWDLATRREIATLQGQRGGISSVAFSPDGKILATGGDDNQVRLWEVATQRQVRMLRGHLQTVNQVAFSPRGRVLASAADDGTVKLWDVGGEPEAEVLAHQRMRVSVAFSPDGRRLIASNGYWSGEPRSGDIRLIDLASRRGRDIWWGRQPGTDATSLSPDGRSLAVARGNGPVQLWDVAARRRITVLRRNKGDFPGRLFFSPDGKLLAMAGDSSDIAVRVWEIASRRQVAFMPGRTGDIHYVTFSPDGRLLAWSDSDPVIHLWDLAARREVAQLRGHTAAVHRVAFSPDGRLLASSSKDHTVKLWSCVTHREIATLEGHHGLVLPLAFTPDGRELASGGADATIRLWNLAARQEVASFTGHRGLISGLAFSPDGTLMASGSWDGTVRLWRAAPLQR